MEGFQALIDSGMVWSLQGAYGRQAAALIEGGYCTDPLVIDRRSRFTRSARAASAAHRSTPSLGAIPARR